MSSYFPQIIVELGFSVDPTLDAFILGDATRGILGQGRLASSVWTDVSDDVVELHTSRGRQRLFEQFRAGTGSVVLDNDEGDYSPHNLSGQYVAGGRSLIQPERRMRFRAVDRYTSTTYGLWYGFIDTISPTWQHPKGAAVTISGSDGFKVFGRHNANAASSPQGAGELSGARINRLLDLAGWPDGDRFIAAGQSTVQATTLAQNVLTELFLTTDSEGLLAAFYMDENGLAVFEDRHYLYEAARCNTVQSTFSDDPSDALHYRGIGTPPVDAHLVKNDVSIAITGGDAATASDVTSQARYWPRPWHRHDLVLDTEAEAQHYANEAVYLSGEPAQRIDSIELTGLPKDTTKWAHILGRRLRDRVAAIRTPDAGDALDLPLFIEGIDHDVVNGVSWETKFSTSSAELFTDPDYMILGSGLLGTNKMPGW